jgi:hypothetical protein
MKNTFKTSRLELLLNWNHTVLSVTYKPNLYTPVTQISFSLQGEMHSAVVHLSSRVHNVSKVAVVALHRNSAGLYFSTSALHCNVAFVNNCWSVTQRLHAVVCIAVIDSSFLRLRCNCVTITLMLTAVDISLQIISFCLYFMLILLFPCSSSLF